MHRKRMLILFLLLVLSLKGSYASAQTAAPAAGTEAASPAAPEQPAVPQPLLYVDVVNGLLTVELVDVQFGDVIKEIAEKAGFKVEISGEVYGKKLNTRFSDIELERGLERLLILIREKNYLFHYDSRGAVAGIDIYGTGLPVGATKAQTPVRSPVQRQSPPATLLRSPSSARPVPTPAPAPTVQKNVPQNLRRILSPMRASQQESMKARRQAVIDAQKQDASTAEEQPAQQPEQSEDVPEENVEETPYVPAPRNPSYVPPREQ